jgi:hypothetical protein
MADIRSIKLPQTGSSVSIGGGRGGTAAARVGDGTHGRSHVLLQEGTDGRLCGLRPRNMDDIGVVDMDGVRAAAMDGQVGGSAMDGQVGAPLSAQCEGKGIRSGEILTRGY